MNQENVKYKLFSESLELVDNHHDMVNKLDIRNAILFYLINFAHKNYSFIGLDITTLNCPIRCSLISNLTKILLDKTINSMEELQSKIVELFEETQDQVFDDLKTKICTLLQTNNKLEIEVIEKKYSDIPKDQYFAIYKKSLGKRKGFIYFRKITEADLIDYAAQQFVFDSKYFKLFLIKEMKQKQEMYLTQMACIMHNNHYFVGTTNNETEIIFELILNTISNLINSSTECVKENIKNIDESTIARALIINSILNTRSEKLDNLCQTINYELIPIDFASSTLDKVILENIDELKKLKPEKLKNIKRIEKRFKLIIKFMKD